MAKIKLLVKTNSNINELKRKEVQAIDWSSFPFEEQIGFVDTETYNKLTVAGRGHIDRALKNYNDKPVEFWNVVAVHNEPYLATKLWRNATLETKGIMLANHSEWFAPFLYSYKLDIGEEDRNSITALITVHGDQFQNELDGYLRFADPSVAFAEFNAPFTMKGKSFPSLLHYSKQSRIR